MIDYCKKHGAHQDPDGCRACLAEQDAPNPDDWFGVAGQDIARYRDHSAYASIKIDLHTHAARFKRLYIWPHVDYSIVMQDTMQFLRLDRVRAFDVDVTNDAKVGEDYRGMGAPIDPVRFTLGSKQDMVETYRDLGSKGILKTPSKGPFVAEFKAQVAEQERRSGVQESRAFGSETVKFGHPSGKHDDLFWSAMLATRAAAPYLTTPTFMVRIPPPKPYDPAMWGFSR